MKATHPGSKVGLGSFNFLHYLRSSFFFFCSEDASDRVRRQPHPKRPRERNCDLLKERGNGEAKPLEKKRPGRYKGAGQPRHGGAWLQDLKS
ncbi:hypothetical protein TNCV_2033821 [Trichonephila clavipes]|nr:hypothetical protein TNCV_2033821 [Trichonephila clavipes]